MSEHNDEFIEHANRATELLKQSVAIHHKERAGELTHIEAIEQVVALNEQAASEMNIAIASLDKESDSN